MKCRNVLKWQWNNQLVLLLGSGDGEWALKLVFKFSANFPPLSHVLQRKTWDGDFYLESKKVLENFLKKSKTDKFWSLSDIFTGHEVGLEMLKPHKMFHRSWFFLYIFLERKIWNGVTPPSLLITYQKIQKISKKNQFSITFVHLWGLEHF